MLIEIGHVEALFRYPVKSMAGERLEEANLGWHGLDGDRRLAARGTGFSPDKTGSRILQPSSPRAVMCYAIRATAA